MHKVYRELAPKVKRSNLADALVVLEDSAPRTTLVYYINYRPRVLFVLQKVHGYVNFCTRASSL